MDPTDRTTTTEPGRSPSNPFELRHTVLYTIAWVFVMAQGWGEYIGSNPTALLYYPTETAARIVNRDLGIAMSTERAGPFDALGSAIHDPVEDVLQASIYGLNDALDVATERLGEGAGTDIPLDRTNARLVIALSEAGHREEALPHIARIGDDELRAAITAIYYRDPDADRSGSVPLEPLIRLAEAGIEGWMLERAAIRLLGAAPGEASSAAIDDLVGSTDGGRHFRRDALAAANLALVALGVLLLIPVAIRLTGGEADTAFAPPWSFALGWSVMVRADFWNRLYFVVLRELGIWQGDPAWLDPFYTWGTLFAALPLLWLSYRYLFNASPGDLLAKLGLTLSELRSTRLAGIALAAVAIDLMGVTAIGWGLYWLGVDGTWSEGLDETLIWGSTGAVISSCIDYLVWTPVFEEFMFRGLLFFTLRSRMRATEAAIASSLLFSMVHFYSFPGFLVTFWSGFVWALTFERARSLLPGITAHAIYNLMFVLGMLMVYR